MRRLVTYALASALVLSVGVGVAMGGLGGPGLAGDAPFSTASPTFTGTSTMDKLQVGGGGISTDGGFLATVPTDTNGFACLTNGCRFDIGTGTTDYLKSDGSNITAAGGFNAAVQLYSDKVSVGATGIIGNGSNFLFLNPGSATSSPTTNVCIGNGTGTDCDGTLTAATAIATTLVQSGSGGAGDVSAGRVRNFNNNTLTLQADRADGAAAVALTVNSTNSFTTAGALLASFKNATVEKASVDKDGKYSMQATDSTGTPGAATIDKPSGQVSVAALAATVVVTNATVSTASIVQAVIQESDATCTFINRVVPGAGTFTITLNATCTADTNVGFVVFN